ncbi:hypothetical protein DRA42_04755 [Ethanoligenens harbinense]|nr:hypothetical protein CXQ68_04745 [Ethanoligenens harbinense YUAN-3]AYF40021.1 hypothetical protein CXP51_04605 [Ethanoligenens harbinense]AYF42852.1 hypothetical protein CN246_04740 [Ethanoligenens harbinense]QCN93612.1 hypothetical protein DRA42_04755 [Ethanoligenens harbinense]
MVHWHFYPTREAAHQAIFENIGVFYNRTVLKSGWGIFP